MKNEISFLKNSRLLRSITLLVVFFAINIVARQIKASGFQQSEQQSMTEELQKNQLSKAEYNKKKGLLIFLDDFEKDRLGAISINFFTALYQEASPIIVSTSLLYTLFEHRSKDNRSIDIIYDELKKEESIREKKDIAISKVAFQADRWIIKEINNSLNLLLPVSYLESLNINKDKVKEYSSVQGTSYAELQLGLRVNHMETIDYKSMNRSMQTRFLNYFFKNAFTNPFANYFISFLDTIFCKKTDYKEKMDIPEWYIFIHGHGFINHSIAHLSFYDFKQLLQFLDNKITTKLVVVLSCYAAGINAETIYGDMKSEMQQHYSFPIIIQGLNDVVAVSQFPDVVKSDEKPIMRLRTDIDFVSFFKKAKELEGKYGEIIRPTSSGYIENIPQIKLPGIEWFSVIDADKKIVSIGSILAKTRDPQKPLDIVSFFKKDPDIILLYADNIPFELKINSYNIKAIVSMVSSGFKKEDAIRTIYEKRDSALTPLLLKIDNWLRRKAKVMVSMISSQSVPKDRVQVIQRIKKISSTMYDFSHMLSWFDLVGSAEGYKWFLIDEMSDNSGIYNKDIFIIGNIYPRGKTVYFKDKDNVLFKEEGTTTERVVSGSDDEKYYYERIRIIRNEYPKLSAKAKEARTEISSEQIKKIENVLIKQLEKQKALAIKNSPSIQ